MSNNRTQTPIIGEKPRCPRHPSKTIDWVCTTGLCNFRVLCSECKAEHHQAHPHHSNSIARLNDWYKEYRKMAVHFDPRQNYQLIYHLEELGMVLKKEKGELDAIGK